MSAATDIRAALNVVREEIPASAADWIDEFLDHNEPGVALDTLVEALMEDGIKPSRAIFDRLQSAAEVMEVVGSDLWLQFERFANPS